MLSFSKSALSRSVTTTRIKEVITQLGCLMCDQQIVDTSKPKANGSTELSCANDPNIKFPLVWRDQLAAKAHVAATPEGRSLNSV